MPTLIRIRVWLGLFIIGLVLSGVTAFPLETESRWLLSVLGHPRSPAPDGLVAWITRISDGVAQTNARYPFMAYGTDWLAFAHLVIAIAFIGPYRDPVRNVWVVHWGMISCGAVLPLALLAGSVRGIPGWWQAIDISFGAVGIIPLLVVNRLIRHLATEQSTPEPATLPTTPS